EAPVEPLGNGKGAPSGDGPTPPERRMPNAERPTPNAQRPFSNEPVRRFVSEEERERLSAALGAGRARLGQRFPLVIGGEEVETTEELLSLNPARLSQVVGRMASAGPAEAKQAVAAALAAFPAWRDRGARERAALLFRAAEIMRARR